MTESSTSLHAAATQRLPDWLLPLGLCLFLSLLIVLPFFWLGSASGHDFEFHVASWLDVSAQWKEGIVFPRWSEWTNHGFGEPRFIFYPPLSWILGAALILLTSGSAAPIVYIMLVQTFAGLSAYLLLRNLAVRRAAILAAACYAINPNALLMTYIRSDFAEQLACAFFPLLLLAALRLSSLLNDSPKRSSIALFAIPYAAIWLSNAPAAVIASYSMALLFAWASFSQRSWRPLLRGSTSLALGLGLAAFYIVPAAYEQRWVNIGQALSSGLLPSQNFLFTWINDAEHTWFNWIASICALLLILIFALAALASRSLIQTNRSRPIGIALLILGAAATLLTLRFTLPLWNYLPKLRFIQFPWRWMSILALVAAYFLAFAMQRRRAWLWFAAILVFSAPLAYFQIQNTWWDDDDLPTMRDALANGQGFDGTDEYDPLGDDHLNLPTDAPPVKILSPESETALVAGAHFQIQRWAANRKQLRVETPSEARVALRLLNYPAWRVTVNGKTISPDRLDDLNQMIVPVKPGASEIAVSFTRTKDRTLGDAVSAISLLLTLFLFWIKTREER
ncbi:MAG TPA: 6-pyruvoyl-tetrahydropterin synthase-related protein [Verrucomicrobiae bacterium]|nr:6-pyruvoyl-tetrahydropterin synthase-related protein [Verrucomicrobiae bacterium]